MAGEWAIVAAGVGSAAATAGIPMVVQVWRDVRMAKTARDERELAAMQERRERLIGLAHEITDAAAPFFTRRAITSDHVERLVALLQRGEVVFPITLAERCTAWIASMDEDVRSAVVQRENGSFRELAKQVLGNPAIGAA